MNVSTSRVGRLPAALGRLTDHSWAGLFVIVVVLTVVMALASRSFLSTFNLFVILRDVSTAVLIGMAQMVVLAIGQMNLSVGAIGGFMYGDMPARTVGPLPAGFRCEGRRDGRLIAHFCAKCYAAD